MPSEITIAGDGSRLTLRVEGYERPAADNIDDANWLNCCLTASVGPFRGAVRLAITTHDLREFTRELQAACRHLEGEVALSPSEDQLELRVSFRSRGQASVSGSLREFGPPDARLSFSFDTDQSFLGDSCDELELCLKEFPIRTEREIR